MEEELRKCIFRLNNPLILDLGCGKPFEYFNLFYQGKSFKYVGVDIKDEFQIFYNQPVNYLPERFKFTQNELMLKSYNTNSNCERELSSQEFLNSFEFHFETEICDFLQSDKRKYDVIALSNVLHKFNKPTAKKIFDLSTLHLSDSRNSIVYVCVIRKELDDKDFPYSSFQLNLIKEMVTVIWECKSDYHLQFIGIRKP